jgi:hypothetical protein
MSDPLTAWSTFFAAVGTVATLVWAVRNGNQLRKDALDEQRIAQARQVSAWFEEISGDIILVNGSKQPVYEVVCYLVWIQEAEPHTGEEAERQFRERGVEPMRAILNLLPPGEFRVDIYGPADWPKGMAHLGVEMAFTDCANRHWVRRAGWGGLRPLASAPTVHYVIPRPLRYSTLEDRGSVGGA